jgi:hypothetical protein
MTDLPLLMALVAADLDFSAPKVTMNLPEEDQVSSWLRYRLTTTSTPDSVPDPKRYDILAGGYFICSHILCA